MPDRSRKAKTFLSSVGNRIMVVLAAVATLGGLAEIYFEVLPRFSDDTFDLASYEPEEASLALMPLLNIGESADNELADSVTAELIESLSEVDGLRIAGAESVLYFKDKSVSNLQVAQMLNVRHLAVGSFSRRGNVIRIALQVFLPDRESPIWMSTVEHPVNNNNALLESVTRQLASVLKVNLTAADEEQFAARSTTTPDVLAMLRRAEKLKRSRDKADMMNALSLIDQARKLDPAYAPAHSEYANSLLGVWSWQQHIPLEQAMSEARASLIEARSLGDDSAIYHAAMTKLVRRDGWANGWDDLKHAQIKASFEQAVARNPQQYSAHSAYAIYLRNEGRLQEALDLWMKFMISDPLHPSANFQRNRILFLMGQTDEAIANSIQLISWYPDMDMYYTELGDRYSALHQYHESVRWFTRAPSYEGRSFRVSHAWVELNDQARAQQSFESFGRFLNIVPGDLPDESDPYWLLAQSDFAGCLDAAKAIIESGSGNRFIINYALRCAVLAGSWQEVVQIYEQNSTVPGMDPLYFGFALHRLGRLDESRRFVEEHKVSSIGRSDDAEPEALILRARVDALLGRHDEAVAAMRQAVEAGWLHYYAEFEYVVAPHPILVYFLSERDDFRLLVDRIDASLAAQREQAVALLKQNGSI